MDRSVTLAISGLQGQADMDAVDTAVQAQYYYRNGSHYLLYEEKMEEDFQRGVSRPVQSRMKLNGGRLELTRRGTVCSHMIFEQGKRHTSVYKVPYGELLLTIDTKKIALAEEEDSIRAVVEYAMAVNGSFQEDRKIIIEIKNG